MSLPTNNIREYCKHHSLSRPPIKWGNVVLAIILFEVVIYISVRVLSLSANSFFLFEEVVHIIALLLGGRVVLRFVVKVYQRYAPESLRRQCTCKPTCSEYALLALQKYYWPKALKLIIRRIVHTCQQPGYKIDYP